MRYLLKYLKGYRKELFLGPLFKLLEAVFEVLVPFVMAGIIDNGINHNDVDYIIKFGLLLLLFAFFGLLSALTCQYFAAKCAYGFGAELKSAIYKKINTFSDKELDKFGTSALATRINNDANLAQTGVNMFIRLGMRAPFLIIGSIVMAFLLDAELALIFVIIAPIISFILYKILHFTLPRYKNNQKLVENLSDKVGENISGIRVIRAFSRQRQESEKFSNMSDDLAKNIITAEKVSSLLNPASTLIMNIGTALIIIIAGHRIFSGSMLQGELTAFVNYMTQISLALVVFANLIVTFTKAGAAASRIEEVLKTDTQMQYGSETSEKSSENVPFIEFRNVSFKYPGAGDDSIENISFKIYKGETIGIIGGTGSGKSTILNLIMRYYDATSGEILINGRDIRTYEKGFITKMTGYVPQKSVLFSGTIADNMRFREPDISKDGIKKCLENACALDFVCDMRDGIESPVLQEGRNFSGGQRQRLCIARAMAGSPKLLILDDSMSALDFATDLHLRQNLANNFKDCTIIIVSQRTVSLQDAKNILVLENGKMTGFDSPKNLITNNETYKEIYDLSVSSSMN